MSTNSKLLGLSIAFLLASVASTFLAAETLSKEEFHIYNALHYRDMQDLSVDNIHDINLIYESRLTDAPALGFGARAFSSKRIVDMAGMSKNDPYKLVSLDLESWKTGPEATMKYINAVEIFRKNSDAKRIGLYGFIPFGNKLLYKALDTNNENAKARWEELQKETLPVAASIDVFMPSMYTWGKNHDAWIRTAEISIQRARAIDPKKPIYVYVWPQYYSADESYDLQFIDTKTWRAELEELYQLADGIILWSSDKDSAGKPIAFSKDMPWYVETINFMRAHNIH